MKKLSVIVPIYNNEKTLNKCIDSILSQTFTDFEVVLIDDGSRDSSLNICKRYAETDERVIVFHKENAGLVAARKTGLELASGEYVGFVDSDDYIDPDMYSSLLDEAEKNKADIVAGGVIVDYPERSVSVYNLLPAGFYDENAVRSKIVPQMLMSTAFGKYGIIPGVVLKIFKKSLLKKSIYKVPDSLTLGEDVAITSHSIAEAKSLSLVNKAAYHYVQTETSMIRGYNPEKFDAACRMYECISGIENKDYKKQTGAHFAYVLFGILADCVRNEEMQKDETVAVIRKLLKNESSEKALSTADISQWKFADKLKVFLMKNKMVKLLYIILKR